MCLEIEGSPRNIKAQDLQEMYEVRKFSKTKDVRQKVTRTLNYMKRVLKDRPQFTNIKWGFVDLYLLISSLLDKYNLTGLEDEFCKFYEAFEYERRQALQKDRKELAAGSYRDRRLFDYLEAFDKQAGREDNVATRHWIYQGWFHSHLKEKGLELACIDPKRAFDQNERSLIWYRAEGKCQECGKEISLEEMHADHKRPHSKGGQTTLSNAQCLCPECNQKKGNNV